MSQVMPIELIFGNHAKNAAVRGNGHKVYTWDHAQIAAVRGYTQRV